MIAVLVSMVSCVLLQVLSEFSAEVRPLMCSSGVIIRSALCLLPLFVSISFIPTFSAAQVRLVHRSCLHAACGVAALSLRCSILSWDAYTVTVFVVACEVSAVYASCSVTVFVLLPACISGMLLGLPFFSCRRLIDWMWISTNVSSGDLLVVVPFLNAGTLDCCCRF